MLKVLLFAFMIVGIIVAGNALCVADDPQPGETDDDDPSQFCEATISIGFSPDPPQIGAPLAVSLGISVDKCCPSPNHEYKLYFVWEGNSYGQYVLWHPGNGTFAPGSGNHTALSYLTNPLDPIFQGAEICIVGEWHCANCHAHRQVDENVIVQ